MYSTCIFCQARLGANEVVEAFPVGRRLAFDAAKGRLWVVCPKCERWNLTPLEERWEAIEQCERRFRDTRLRVSTDHIGLARLKEGLVLVRIGEPQRPEMAAWRYGDQFGRRRRKFMLMAGGIGVAAAGVIVAGPVLGLIGLGILSPAYSAASVARLAYEKTRRKLRIPLGDGETLQLERTHAGRVMLDVRDDGQWLLRVLPPGRTVVDGWRTVQREQTRELTGGAAIRAAAAVLPAANGRGARPGLVQEAVGLLDATPSPDALFAEAASSARGLGRGPYSFTKGVGYHHVPVAMCLALEMAAHEEQERRALEGELAELERAWQDAESIAAIADGLLQPASVDPAMARLRGRARDDAQS